MTTEQQGQKPALVRDTACLSDGGVSAPALWMSEALLFPLMTDRITKTPLPLYTACLAARKSYTTCLVTQKQAYCLLHGIGLLPCQKTTSLFILHCRRCLLDFQTGLT